MKKILSGLTILAIMLQTVVFANSADKNIVGKDIVTYDGVAKANSTVTVTILDGEITLDEFMEDGSTAVPICYREVKTDSEGKYSIAFNIGTASNTFNVYIGKEGADKVEEGVITYINEDENDDARDALFTPVANAIKDNAAALGMSKKLEDKMEAADWLAAENIYAGSKKPADTLEDVQTTVNKVAAVALFNADKLELFGDSTELFDIPSTVSDWLDKAYMTDSILDDVEKNVAKTAASTESFDKLTAKAVALAVVENADGYGEVKKYLTDNAAFLDINANKVTDSLCKSLVGNKYSSVDDMGIDTYTWPSGNGGGSTGSRPGNSGGGMGGSYVGTTDKEPLEPIVEEKAEFSDLDSVVWAVRAISELYNRDIINGKAEGIFAPQDNVLREEFVKIIVSAIGFENIEGEINFSDVSNDAWYYEWVKRAYLCGVVNGESEDTFGSGKQITRQDMAVMCYNALIKAGKITKADLGELKFNDAEMISDYAKEAVSALSENNVISGDDMGNFAPLDFATRAEAAQMIYNLLRHIEK